MAWIMGVMKYQTMQIITQLLLLAVVYHVVISTTEILNGKSLEYYMAWRRPTINPFCQGSMNDHWPQAFGGHNQQECSHIVQASMVHYAVHSPI